MYKCKVLYTFVSKLWKMNVQILPNWCKKAGLVIFIVFSILGGWQDFMVGFYDGVRGLPYNPGSDNDLLLSNNLTKSTLHFFTVVSMIGMLIYMFSKEKVEDDYIHRLRLESFQLTAVIGLLTALVLYGVSRNIELTLDYFITLFLWLYFIVFFIKKRLY